MGFTGECVTGRYTLQHRDTSGTCNPRSGNSSGTPTSSLGGEVVETDPGSVVVENRSNKVVGRLTGVSEVDRGTLDRCTSSVSSGHLRIQSGPVIR